MTVDKVLILARKHLGSGSMESSARLCLSDAIRLLERGASVAAKNRALQSLVYSVGVFHADYRRACR